MSLQLLGKKKGMTVVFDEKGDSIACTIIEAEPNTVVQIKTKEKDGYSAVQLGGPKILPSKKKNVTKPLKGHFSKAKVEPTQHLKESRIDGENAYVVGQEIGVEYFDVGSYVDIIGTTKGKGFQGVIKRHGFSGGPASHGSSFHRSAGSTGMRSSPGRALPGHRRAGHMGNVQMTVQSLKVISVDKERKILLVKGAVPGSREGLVKIRRSKKR